MKQIPNPRNPEALKKWMASTPAQIGTGRAGTRFLTRHALEMRAGHAIAKDAVYSEVETDFVSRLGCVLLQSRARDREEYLLYPERGRELDSHSLEVLKREATQSCDVQIIVGDGLSAWAVERNVPELLPLLDRELKSLGFSVGRPLFVRFARVGVQDAIGVLTQSRSTIILLGERPGLGTGDSLSAYLAYGPRLRQDNSEKNCISNIRALGVLPAEAARQSGEILKNAFLLGRGGISR